MTVTFKREDLKTINMFVKSIKDLQAVNTGSFDEIIDTLIKGIGTFVLACDKPEQSHKWNADTQYRNPRNDRIIAGFDNTSEDDEIPGKVGSDPEPETYQARTMPIGYIEGMGVYL